MLRRGEPRLRGNGGVQLLTRNGRHASELARGHLGVLRLDRRGDIARRQLERRQLVGVEPDTHRVLRAERLHLTHPGHAAYRVLQRGRDVVGDVVADHAAVFRAEHGDHQEVAVRLGDAHALALYLLG